MTPTLPNTAPRLAALTLPDAPPVVRAAAAPRRRRRLPALVLLGLGVLLVVGPVAGGLFVKVASGQQMIDAFEPHLTVDALGRYENDLQILRSGAESVEAAYREDNIPEGRYPGVDIYRTSAQDIDARATALLERIRAAEPDYRRVADIGGFDRVPFLLVAAGLALTYAGGVLLSGRRQRAGGAAVLALAAAAALIAYPLVSSLPSGSRAGERLQDALAPVMTPATVLRSQQDFVVLVHAVGELDTSFQSEAHGAGINDLVKAWPAVSSDLASLVGTINDNISNYEALEDLDGLTRSAGFSGLIALPWFLVGVGVVSAAAALASLTRPRKAQQ